MASDSFLSRWSKRKIEGPESEENRLELPDSELNTDIVEAEQTDVIDIDVTQTDESDDKEKPESIASLLASQAAKETKKAALRKLFLSGEFSEVDRLNDYDHDYSSVKPLAQEVAQKLREWIHDTDIESDNLEGDEEQIADEVLADSNEEAVGDYVDVENLQTNETKNTT